MSYIYWFVNFTPYYYSIRCTVRNVQGYFKANRYLKIMMNNKKILLVVESPVEKQNYINTLPPLGILYIVSFLESKGIEADVVDCNVDKLQYSMVGKYDVVGFSVHSANVNRSLATAEKIKRDFPDIKIIFGGPNILSDPEYFIKKDFIDVVVDGEGESTVYEYLTRDVRGVKGLYFKDNGKIVFTGKRPWRVNLDELPFPSLNKVDISRYNVPLKKKKPISSIITSRGCPFGCIYCFHSLGTKWRYRSAENTVDEIEWQVNRLGVREICVEDDNMSLNIKRAEKIYDLIIQRNINVKIQLHNGVRADKLNVGLVRKMKKAGVWLFSVAPESGNPETLIKVNKGLKLEFINKAVKWAKQNGLYTYSFFMIGFPWETKEDIETTIKYAKELDTDFTQFSRVIPFKNTILYGMYDIKNYDFEKDQGLFYDVSKCSKVDEREMNRLIKKAYRSCFLKPRVIYKLLTNISLKDVFLLLKYSFITGSV